MLPEAGPTTLPLVALRPPETAGAAQPVLDDGQRRAARARADVVRVLGGPGTGTTTVSLACVVDRVERDGVSPDEVLLVAPTRLAAAAARDALTIRLGGTTTSPLVRTMQSLGFAILAQRAALTGAEPPRLISGPEQDAVLGELLAGHAADGTGPDWPEGVRLAVPTRGFRDELRDLVMRAVEQGVDAPALAALGATHDRPEWVSAAQVLAEYDEVTALARPGAYDPAWVLTAAAELLEHDVEARDRVRASIRVVVVDDAQELTAPGVRLLRQLTGAGTDLVLVGDPDAAVQTFRGAEPRHLVGPWPGRTEETHVLERSYRLPEALAAAAGRIAPKIGGLGGARQRGMTATRPGGRCEVHLLRAASQEAAFVAQTLRRAHLVDGVPWSDLAVVVRGSSRVGALRRVLAARGVPVAVATADLPLRDEPAVRPLLSLLGLVVDLRRGVCQSPQTDLVVDVLTSPLIGVDAVALRRMRRALRHEELLAGGGRTSDELLAQLVLDPERLAHLGREVAPLRSLARVLEAGLAAAPSAGEGHGFAPLVSAEGVLWALWEASGQAPRWQAQALAGGVAGARADRDLDALVALFDAAAAHEDAMPRSGPASFLDAIAGREVAGDSLSARSPSEETVALVTPQSAAGREWHTVVVAGVQEGSWPDLRLRGSLLGSEDLVDVVTGRDGSLRAAQAKVRHDETRLFYVALTRARQRVVVTAVRSEDEQPSVYLDLVDPLPGAGVARPATEVPLPLDLAGVVAGLRQQLAEGTGGGAPGPGTSDEAVPETVARLARLADAEVPGADPSDWWALRGLSDVRPLRAEGEPVPVSPSKVELFGECQLRWVLTAHGGSGPSIGAADLGTLIHGIAHDLGDVDVETFRDEIDRRWALLGLPPGWVTEQQRVKAHRMAGWLVQYQQRAAAEGWEKVGSEVTFQAEVGRAQVRGSVDRLERDAAGALRVVDYKTGSKAATRKEVPVHPQLATYQVAVESGAFVEGDRSAGAALVYVGKAANRSNLVQHQAPLAESEDPAWAARLVAETAEGMAGSSFTATEGKRCETCPVRTSCPLQPEGGMLG